MKLRVISDLHTEMNLPSAAGMVPYHPSDADTTLVIAGDLGVVRDPETTIPYIDHFCNRFRDVVYIAGNHEFYGSEIGMADYHLKNLQYDYDNLHYGSVFNDGVFLIDDVRFICTPLFCDMGNDPIKAIQIKQALMDFQVIRNQNRYVNEEDYMLFYQRSRDFIFENIRKDGYKEVVVTHWTPSYQSVPKRFKGSPINGGFSNPLDNEIERWGPEVWIHGHTHTAFDYRINDHTRVVCNPRGYNHEDSGYDPNFYIEV